MKVLFLGSGTSVGVPVIGCRCEVCRSVDPRNKRLRSSVLVTTASTQILIDCGPDLRAQALRYIVSPPNAVLVTHEHLDHIAGFDDLRAFCWHREDRLPLYAGKQCLTRLRTMYPWAFDNAPIHRGYVRAAGICHNGKAFEVGDVHVQPVPVIHSTVETHGYVLRNGDTSFGYVPDVKELPHVSREYLRGLDVLAMDGLCFHTHRTHLSIEENVAIMQELKPRIGFITHTGHRIDYHALAASLPDFIRPAYDGLDVTIRGNDITRT